MLFQKICTQMEFITFDLNQKWLFWHHRIIYKALFLHPFTSIQTDLKEMIFGHFEPATFILYYRFWGKPENRPDATLKKQADKTFKFLKSLEEKPSWSYCGQEYSLE